MAERPPDHKPVYTIRIAAALSGVTSSTIREYEKQGLLRPYRSRQSNHRLFSYREILWVQKVWRLIHEEGLNVEGIRRLIAVEPCWKVLRCSPEARAACGSQTWNGTICWNAREERGCCRDASVVCQECEVYLRGADSPLLSVKKPTGMGETVSR